MSSPLSKLKSLTRELTITAVLILVASNLVSWLRSPTLDSDELPPFELSLVSGERLSSSQLKGAPLVIYFWGTWCSDCSLQSPSIQSLVGEAQVLSVAVKSGDQRELQRYQAQEGYSFPIYIDHDYAWTERFKVSAFPTIFIFDAHGKLRFTEVGFTSAWGLRARLAWLAFWA